MQASIQPRAAATINHSDRTGFSLQLPPIQDKEQLFRAAATLAEIVRQLETLECETDLGRPGMPCFHSYQSRTLKAARAELTKLLAAIGLDQIKA